MMITVSNRLLRVLNQFKEDYEAFGPDYDASCKLSYIDAPIYHSEFNVMGDDMYSCPSILLHTLIYFEFSRIHIRSPELI